jgi:hypothetical protein
MQLFGVVRVRIFLHASPLSLRLLVSSKQFTPVSNATETRQEIARRACRKARKGNIFLMSYVDLVLIIYAACCTLSVAAVWFR